MWFELAAINYFALFAGILHPVEMRIRKRLRKLWCYIKWYIYTPFWHWIYLPVFARYRLIRKPIRRFKRKAIVGFWAFVDFVERSPQTLKDLLVRSYAAVKLTLLKIPGMPLLIKLVKALLKAYFSVVNFRRLLIGYILADIFIYRWTEQAIDKDLRIWNICMLTIFFNVLYMLMDGADGKLRLFSHDFITRLYLSKKLGIKPGPVLTDEQMSDPFISRYIRARHMRNAYLCLIGFFYTGQPLFRP